VKRSKVVSVFTIVTSCLALSLSACSPASPKLVPLPLVKKERVRNTGGSKVSFNRAVDILFVVDDSGSMGEHQSSLAKNVQLFTQGIWANQILDFHIGVTSSNMDSDPYQPKPGYGWRGELNGVTKFVSRNTPNGQRELESNLLIGLEGSGSEEFFTPVQSALTAPMVQGPNRGFFRQDAYLAVIFVTDSDDQSKLSATDFYKFLVNLKGGDPSKIIVYGVYIPKVDKTCNRSSENLPDKLEEFFGLAKAQTLGLCDADYGMKLSELGADLVRRVGSVLYLSRPPQPDTIFVTFGSQTLPNDPKKGWVFDPVRNALVFGDEIDLQPEPQGTQVEVDFTAAAEFDGEE
jgi:hypothetical protein